jgi:hypothetical protein
MATLPTDTALAMVVGELKAAIRRRSHGRVNCTVEVLEGMVAGHLIICEDLTEEDVDRRMGTRPPGGTRGR